MSLLTSHIERLLLHHDCVIVPGLGGFVAQECGARYVEEEDLFLPPYRTVTFNSRLNLSDGLLAAAIARSEGMTFEAASTWVVAEVETIRRTIAERGSYLFPGVGQLEATRTAAYEFTPISCGILSPALYGLDSCYVLTADEALAPDLMPKPALALHHANERTKGDTTSEEVINRQDDDTTEHDDQETGGQPSNIYSIGTQVLHYISAASVIAVCYIASLSLLPFSLSQSAMNEASMFDSIASLVDRFRPSAPAPANLEFKDQATTSKMDKVATAKTIAEEEDTHASHEQEEITTSTSSVFSTDLTEAKSTEAITSANHPATATTATTGPSTSHPFTLVLASALPKDRAEGYAEECRQAGMTDVSVYVRGRMNRVVSGAFATETEARNALRTLTREHPEVADAWIYCIPQ